MTNTVRYYYEIAPELIIRFGGHKYLTAQYDRSSETLMPQFAYQLMSSSDRVIRCDSNSIRYVKNRFADFDKAMVDPQEFLEIKLRSIEIG